MIENLANQLPEVSITERLATLSEEVPPMDKHARQTGVLHGAMPSGRAQHFQLAVGAALVGAFATASCNAGWAHRTVAVQLQPMADTAPARWSGMTNIFFDGVPAEIRDSVRLGQDWTAVELADVVRGDSLVTVYAARFRLNGTGEVHYVVDADGGLDFSRRPFLTFQRRDGVAVANLDIEVRTRSGTRRRVPYQVLRSDDGYTYARIASYVEGRARLRGHDYLVRARRASRNHPFYGLDQGTRFWIDLGGDDSIAEQPSVSASGHASSSDEVMPGAPFLLAGRPYELAALDSAGSRLLLRPSATRVASAVGFVAPALAGNLLGGGRYTSEGDRGRVVLVEFWSAECHFSELARPRLDELAARLRGAPFTWVALAREDDSVALRRHLADHPMSATVTLYDSTAWTAYDPSFTTPLFYVIDGRGVVRLRAVGASAVDAVAAEVSKLLDGVPARPSRH